MKLISMCKVAITFLSLVLCSSQVSAELKALADEDLSSVSGQSGLTLDLEANVKIAEVAYFDDGAGIAMQGVRLASAADPDGYAEFRFLLDFLNDGSLVIDYNTENVARFEIEDIRFVDTPGVTPGATDPSIGGFFFDFNIDGQTTVRNFGGDIPSLSATGGVYDIAFQITDGRLGYRTNGNEFFLDGLTVNVNSPGTILGATNTNELVLSTPSFLADVSVDAIRYSNNPANHGVTNDVTTGAELPSYGSLWANFDLNSTLRVLAGGRAGSEGLTINSSTTINRVDLAYGDDTDFAATGYWVGLLGASGQVDVTNLTVDILADPDAGVTPAKDFGVGLALAWERIEASVLFADVVLGETKNNIDAYVAGTLPTLNSIGSLGVNLVFADATYNGQAYSNRVYVQAGGNTDAGYQGLRFDTELSILGSGNESNLVYIDDGYSLMFSSLEAFAKGDLTLDVTAAGTLGSTEFFDGLRFGFEDFAYGYRIEGFRTGRDTGNTDDLKSEELMSAGSYDVLDGGVFGFGGASSEGVLNGHITLGPGGNVGQEGITVNADISVTDGARASYLESDGSGRGIWLSGLNYDVHLRDMMLDVTSEGLRIYQTESWSRLDVTDLRVGDKVSGSSFGRLALETFEQGSISTISAGGAGAVCIGGVASTEAACGSVGGRWEDRGTQGVTISSERHFQDSIEAEGKRNRFTWETGRTGEGTAGVVNGTGLQLVFDNFTTNDGDGLTDTFGFRTTQSLDVASAYVVKKSDGADGNGVVGAKGSVKVMNGDGTYRYVDPAALTASDLQNLPVGVATRTNTQFMELDFDRVNLVNSAGESSTLLYGLKLQNFDVTTDITATPLD